MDYWEGVMDWPLEEKWKCEFCGKRCLIWGLPHALSRCNNCHVQYRMRDKQDQVVSIPICQVKLEYYQAYKKIYAKTGKPIDEVTSEEWDTELKN